MQQTDTFNWPIRVYYEDTDSGGVVYHANYLNFMERARTEWLRALGFEQTVLQETFKVLFVVHSMQLQFKKPARFNDLITVKSICTNIGFSSLAFKQTITRDAQILHTAEVKVACVHAEKFKSVAIPQAIKTLLLDKMK
jgi:acyl-CoA thioester hydrolase